MNEKLEIPRQFDGSWEQLLILTYSVDVPFFETTIWRELSDKCRNKIILVDGEHYLEACSAYAENGITHYLNQKYVVEGIFLPRAAHAKVILLTSRDKGRLLIGSGNLTWQGYASGGELFTQYDYNIEHSEMLGSFQSLWNIVEDLIDRKVIGPSALPYLELFRERTPWLAGSIEESWQPVRSNLESSFLDQLLSEIKGESISDLWVLAPFFDQNAIALKNLIEKLSPNNIHLLVQPESTSLDPQAVLSVLNNHPGKWEIIPFSSISGDESKTYIHAKMYLVNTPTRSFCLQGSPNLSQVAMLLPISQGNLEIANFLIGSPLEFDEIIKSLSLAPAIHDFSGLNLSCQQDQVEHSIQRTDLQMISAEWKDEQLLLYFRGQLPSLSKAKLKIGSCVFDLDIMKHQENVLVVRLTVQAQSLLVGTTPVYLIFGSQHSENITNPVFPCNVESLLREISETLDTDIHLEKLGDFNLEDEELEKMFAELGSSLAIDRQSIWYLAGKTPPNNSIDGNNDEALRLSYADIDYQQLRLHPKILQYSRVRNEETKLRYSPSRLQIILSSITANFKQLENSYKGNSIIANPNPRVGMELLDEFGTENVDENEVSNELNLVKLSKPKKVNPNQKKKLLKGFIERYLRGLKSTDFIELVGFEVIANNYVIFSHILWRLLEKEWIEQEFILDSFFQIWEFVWGIDNKPGYLDKLDKIEKNLCLQLFRQDHTLSQCIATIFYGDYLCQRKKWVDRRLSLRNFYLRIIQDKLFDIDSSIIEETWIYADSMMPYERPLPGYIFECLANLAKYETRQSFLRKLEENYGFNSKNCEIDSSQSFFQKHLNHTSQGDCLVINDAGNILNRDLTLRILRSWIKYQSKDYYRIVNKSRTITCWYCPTIDEGLYFQKNPACDETLINILAAPLENWEIELNKIQKLANQVNMEVSINLQIIQHSPTNLT